MKKLMLVFSVALAAVSFAEVSKTVESDKTSVKSEKKKIDRQRLKETIYRYNGPMLSAPGEQKGKIVFLSSAKRVPAEWLEEVAADFRASTQMAVEVAEGPFDLASPKLVGNATLFVVDDAKLPSLLLAPEAAWCMVNVSSLAQGAGEKPAYFSARVRKELTRGVSLLAGAQTSNYPDSLMGCVTKPEDLDRFVDCRLPVDVPARFKDYLAGYGMRPDVKLSYRKACQEGWAPAPTNEVEKAIWDQVNSVPKNPMKIEFDPKKGR